MFDDDCKEQCLDSYIMVVVVALMLKVLAHEIKKNVNPMLNIGLTRLSVFQDWSSSS